MGLMKTKIGIEEKEIDKKYSGTVNVSLQKTALSEPEDMITGLQFEMELKLPGQEIEERAMKAKSPEEAQKVLEKNVLINLRRPDGTEVKFSSKVEEAAAMEMVRPPIFQAYGLLIDQMIKEQNKIRFEEPRSYMINGIYYQVRGGGKKLEAASLKRLDDEPEEAAPNAITIGKDGKPRLMTDDSKIATQFNQIQQAVQAALDEMGYKSIDELMAKEPKRFGEFMKKRTEILERNRK